MSSRTQPKVLIVDDDKAITLALTRRCQSMGISPMECHTAEDALRVIQTAKPDAVVLDLEIPAQGGWSVCETLRRDEAYARLPVIIITGHSGDDTLRRCQELNADYVEKGADIWPRIELLLKEALAPVRDDSPMQDDQPSDQDGESLASHKADGLPETKSRISPQSEEMNQAFVEQVFAALGCDPDFLDTDFPDNGASAHAEKLQRDVWILHVDDSSQMRDLVKMRLETDQVKVVSAFDGQQGIRCALNGPASAIILDYEMPNGCGDDVLRSLKANPLTRYIPVIILTGKRDNTLEYRLLELGACAFFNKPVDFELLRLELGKHIDLGTPGKADMQPVLS